MGANAVCALNWGERRSVGHPPLPVGSGVRQRLVARAHSGYRGMVGREEGNRDKRVFLATGARDLVDLVVWVPVLVLSIAVQGVSIRLATVTLVLTTVLEVAYPVHFLSKWRQG